MKSRSSSLPDKVVDDPVGYDSSVAYFADQVRRFTALVRLKTGGRAVERSVAAPGSDEEAELEGRVRRMRAELGDIEQGIEGRLAETPDEALGLAEFAKTFGLDEFAMDVAILSILPQLDPGLGEMIQRFHEDPTRGFIDPETAIQLLSDDLEERIGARRHFDPAGPLLANKVVVLEDTHYVKRFMRFEIRPSPGTVRALLREAASENPLSGFCELVEPRETLDNVILPPELKDGVLHLVDNHWAVLQRLQQATDEGGGWGVAAGFARAAYRGRNTPDYRYFSVGFRTARSIR